MPSTAEQRAAGRESYARNYPIGLKRKRSAEQRRKQRVAQARYEKHVRRGPRRQMSEAVKRWSRGRGDSEQCKAAVGLSIEAFVQHLRSTMVDPSVAHYRLCYHKALRSFDMHDSKQRQQAYHYTNIYAIETGPMAVLRAARHFSLESAKQYAAQLTQ